MASGSFLRDSKRRAFAVCSIGNSNIEGKADAQVKFYLVVATFSHRMSEEARINLLMNFRKSPRHTLQFVGSLIMIMIRFSCAQLCGDRFCLFTDINRSRRGNGKNWTLSENTMVMARTLITRSGLLTRGDRLELFVPPIAGDVHRHEHIYSAFSSECSLFGANIHAIYYNEMGRALHISRHYIHKEKSLN